jgi:hypothetical protein
MARRDKPNPFSAKGQQQVDLRAYDDEEFYEDELDGPDSRTDEHKVFGLGIQNAEERQPTYGQGIVFALIIAAALLLCAIIAIGDGDGSIPPMLQRATPLLWAVSLIALVLSAAGAQYSEYVTSRAAAANGDTPVANRITTAWVIPFVSVFAATLLVATYHNRWMLLFGPALAFIGMAASLLSRDLLDEAEEPSVRTASVISSVVGIVVAFFAFGAVYINKLESILAVPLIGVLSFILLLEALERAGLDGPTRALHAGIGAWIMAATMLALNWWPTWGWGGAAVLTGMFYIVYGLLVTNAEGRPFTRNKMLEIVGVGSAVLLIVALRDVIL